MYVVFIILRKLLILPPTCALDGFYSFFRQISTLFPGIVENSFLLMFFLPFQARYDVQQQGKQIDLGETYLV
jgi:hypothetical protein